MGSMRPLHKSAQSGCSFLFCLFFTLKKELYEHQARKSTLTRGRSSGVSPAPASTASDPLHPTRLVCALPSVVKGTTTPALYFFILSCFISHLHFLVYKKVCGHTHIHTHTGLIPEASSLE